MRRGIFPILALLGVLLAPAIPVGAGGFATVRLDEPLATALVEVPWQIGFMVKQHDVTPTNDVTPRLDARHRETGEAVTAVGRQAGEVGHFVLDVTFPVAGDWKWGITPDPFPGTSFETLTVLSGPSDLTASQPDPHTNHPAHIHRGSCDDLGDVVFPLSSVGPGVMTDGTPTAEGMLGSANAVPVAISVTTVDVTLDELLAGDYAINVHQSDREIESYVACGDIGGRMVDDTFIVGLQQLNDSGDVGIAQFRADGAKTIVNLSMLAVEPATSAATSAARTDAVKVEIVNGGNLWMFNPDRVKIPVGGTVDWTNATTEAHTITGDDLQFADSGVLDRGQSFRETFETPGTYTYRCGPHPWMIGTIVVT